MLRLFSWAPAIYFQWLKRQQMPWRAACKILRGEKGYTSLREQLGPMQLFFDLVRGL